VQLGGSGGDQIFDGCTVTVNTGGTLDFNGQSETITALTGSGGTILNNGGSASTLTLNSTATNTYSGIIANGSFGAGGMSFVKSGSGIQTLSGANTYSGSTTVNGGTLKAGVATTGANGAFGNASAVTLANVGGS
jgi:autotransporter-associated beta strand protein